MTHDQVSELLASFALDAVDGDEHAQIELHLHDCPRCRAELDSHREVAAALGNSVETPPEGVWSGIVSRLPERHDEEPPPMPRLVREQSGRRTQPDGVPEPSAAPGRFRRGGVSRGPIATIGAFAMAAAAVAAVLGINLVRANDKVMNLQSAADTSSQTAVVAALQEPGHQLVNLDNAHHVQLARFVVVPAGRGYLVSSKLPALSHGHTYQLWGIIGGQPISLGLLGQSPSQVTFTTAGSTPSRLSVTVEPAGGSVVPSSSIVASGIV